MTGERSLGRIAKRARGAFDGLRSVANRVTIAIKDRRDISQLNALRAAVPSVKDRQQELIQFYHHYEHLVETLCNAAQLGPSPRLEERYAAERHWIKSHYAPVRKYVVAYLRYSADDAEQGLALNGRSADAFEALVAAPTLEEFLAADDGNMISRINRTREALNLYGEHLRQLSANG